MYISDLKIVIENPRGSYKKFADSLDEYPLLGVTFPTDYGYIQGYVSEDGHDLDVFVGSGTLAGYLQMKRDDFPNGVETKTFFNISANELEEIKNTYRPVLGEVKLMDSEAFIGFLGKFRQP